MAIKKNNLTKRKGGTNSMFPKSVRDVLKLMKEKLERV